MTLIVGAGTKVRVTQGFLDVENERLIVRTTKVKDLEAGSQKCWDDILTILAWFLASPVGKTT